MKRQYLHWAQKKLSRMDNTWRDNIYIEHRRSYQEWTIHEETISTLSIEEAIKNGQYMKRQYLHWAQKKLSRMDNTWRDNIYIISTWRSYQEWTIHEETISTSELNVDMKKFMNGQYMIASSVQYLHSAQKKLSRDGSRMDNRLSTLSKRQYLRDNSTLHRRSYQEWTIHEETISTFSTEEAINEWTIDMKRSMDNTSTFYIEHRRSYQEWTIHEETISTLQHRRSYQEWTIHEETISTLSTEEAIKNGQ